MYEPLFSPYSITSSCLPHAPLSCTRDSLDARSELTLIIFIDDPLSLLWARGGPNIAVEDFLEHKVEASAGKVGDEELSDV